MHARVSAFTKEVSGRLRKLRRGWRDLARTTQDNRLVKLLGGFVVLVVITIAATAVVFNIGTTAVVTSFNTFMDMNEFDEDLDELIRLTARLHVPSHAVGVAYETEGVTRWRREVAVIDEGLDELQRHRLAPQAVVAIGEAKRALGRYKSDLIRALDAGVTVASADLDVLERSLTGVSQELLRIKSAVQGGIETSAIAFAEGHGKITTAMLVTILLLLAAASFAGGVILWRLVGLLREAELLSRTKGEFMSMMGHELRTPLNGVIGMSDMMQREMFGPLGQRYREYASLVYRSARQLQIFLDDILELVHTGPDTASAPESVPLCALVEDALSLLGPQRSKRQVAVTSSIGSNVYVSADPTMLRRVAIAIIGNAIKFTPDGGAVTITAERRGDRIAFVVADTGIGISAPFVARVTDPFFQVEHGNTRKYDGGGIGLAMVKRLVDLNKGTLAIESEVGKGTTVHIVLPSAEPLPQAA
jgi:signal transduction histidine kinase